MLYLVWDCASRTGKKEGRRKGVRLNRRCFFITNYPDILSFIGENTKKGKRGKITEVLILRSSSPPLTRILQKNDSMLRQALLHRKLAEKP
ncbi:hypothetical protein BJP37_08995 [Moorena bouillonii PNG]|uniref:Uncharacterized protein n=1 Tax=Moorena bouillonii PNG TaxID=568701 RepID=A0A1U7MZL7_9CYAN|nr:hypothetical protein BJP37_08995 [Moorena bouillonii PNG]